MTTKQDTNEEQVVLQVRIFEDIKNKANSILAKDGMQVQDLLRFVVLQMIKNGKSPMHLDFFNADSKQDQFDNVPSNGPQNTPEAHGERTPIQVRFTREQKDRANKILEEEGFTIQALMTFAIYRTIANGRSPFQMTF